MVGSEDVEFFSNSRCFFSVFTSSLKKIHGVPFKILIFSIPGKLDIRDGEKDGPSFPLSVFSTHNLQEPVCTSER